MVDGDSVDGEVARSVVVQDCTISTVSDSNVASEIQTIEKSPNLSLRKEAKKRAKVFHRYKLHERVFHGWLLSVVGTYDMIVKVADVHRRTGKQL